MGTETSLNKYVHLSKNTLEVKLNNPLMGTETNIYVLHHHRR